MIVTSKNQHIRDFLSYYCALNSPPEYAVLIKGLWGTGKTWFIQNYLEELRKEGQDHLYVSLYGATSFEAIENDFFRQLHPLLSSKSMKLLGKLTKGLLKTTIRLDIDDDGQSDGTITIGVPNEKLLDSLKVSENTVLVFDDIERCSISICDLLGYINHFVEHNGFKVILIANENEIIERERTNESNFRAYRQVKEKLVGKTFAIEPELVPALEHFVAQLQCERAKSTIEENKPLVIQLYDCSQYKNLRILRHALWDFARLFAKLSLKITENKALVSRLLELFLVYSFEIMSGTIYPDEILKLRRSLYASIGLKNGQNNPDQKYLDIVRKYTGIDLHDSLFDESIWQSIFGNGAIPLEEIQEAVLNSKYFQSENQPNWVRLWHAVDLSDSEFETILAKVEKEWKAKTYKEIGIVKHVAGMLLWLSAIGLYRETKTQILEFSKLYVDKLKEQGHLLARNTKRPIFFDVESWAGLGFHSKDEETFKELNKYISEKQKDALLESYTTEAGALLVLMKEDTEKFFRSLILCNHEDNRFYDVPILRYLFPVDFVNTFLELSPDQRKIVSYVFDERYKFEELDSKLVGEIAWLKETISLLQKVKADRYGKMSAYTIGLVIDRHLNNAVARLEAVQVNG